jgi:hypothetical protein
MPEFSFTFASEDALAAVIAAEFSDQTVLLPDWVLDAIAFYEMEHDQQQEFLGQCKRVQYAEFLARCKEEAMKIERQESKDYLNRIQHSFVAGWFARRRLFKPVRSLRGLMR